MRPVQKAAPAAIALFAAAALLGACGGGEREAEAKVGTAEAEVSTNLPESQVSDQQLQNAAEGAAAMAQTPQAGASVVVTPPSTGAAPAAGAPGTTTSTTTTTAPTNP